ncbi:MAG: hypothetical protein ACM3VV_08285 [Deltaproteobacteria bacterium]
MSSYETNKLSSTKKNRPIDQLDHRYGRGKWISDEVLEDLALKKYSTNGRGITFSDLIEEFRCSKDKAQRRLKNAYKEKIDKKGKKSSTLFKLDNKRTIPQQYFPSCIKAKIIEDRRKKQNRLIGTTGDSYHTNKGDSSSCYPLCNAIENQIVSSFLTQLSLLPFQPLNIHNIHILTIIDKGHYEEITQKPWSDDNKTKIERERIGLREVVYKFHKRGSIEIDISCSKYLFKIETDDDANNFFVFLGQVKDRLANILNDPRERIVPPVDNWTLKYCDFNKDVEIEDKDFGQLMDLNIQIKHAGKAFRLYVKNLDNRSALRGERVMKVNQPVTTFINDSIVYPNHLIYNKIDELTSMIQKLNTKIDIIFNRQESNC